jgi:hypothetical protein
VHPVSQSSISVAGGNHDGWLTTDGKTYYGIPFGGVRLLSGPAGAPVLNPTAAGATDFTRPDIKHDADNCLMYTGWNQVGMKTLELTNPDYNPCVCAQDNTQTATPHVLNISCTSGCTYSSGGSVASGNVLIKQN